MDRAAKFFRNIVVGGVLGTLSLAGVGCGSNDCVYNHKLRLYTEQVGRFVLKATAQDDAGQLGASALVPVEASVVVSTGSEKPQGSVWLCLRLVEAESNTWPVVFRLSSIYSSEALGFFTYDKLTDNHCVLVPPGAFTPFQKTCAGQPTEVTLTF